MTPEAAHSALHPWESRDICPPNVTLRELAPVLKNYGPPRPLQSTELPFTRTNNTHLRGVGGDRGLDVARGKSAHKG